MREVRLEYLRPEEILAEQSRQSLVFLPVGAIEWHGPHLPLGVDMMLAHEVAVRVAREVGGVVHPAIYCGTERERSPQMLRNIGFEGDEWVVGMDFPENVMKSYYYPEESFALMVREAIALLIEHGYEHVVIVNGHGAENQIATLQRLAAAFTAKGKAKVTVLLPFPEEYDEEGRPTTAAGHADIYETSAMLALHPQCVDLEALPALDQPLHNTEWAVVDGPTFSGNPTSDYTVRPEYDPRNASLDGGERALRAIVTNLVAQVQEAMK